MNAQDYKDIVANIPHVKKLATGYFHQDWGEESQNALEVLERCLVDLEKKDALELRAEFEYLIALKLDERQPEWLWNSIFWNYYIDPKIETYTNFLTDLKKIVIWHLDTTLDKKFTSLPSEFLKYYNVPDFDYLDDFTFFIKEVLYRNTFISGDILPPVSEDEFNNFLQKAHAELGAELPDHFYIPYIMSNGIRWGDLVFYPLTTGVISGNFVEQTFGICEINKNIWRNNNRMVEWKGDHYDLDLRNPFFDDKVVIGHTGAQSHLQYIYLFNLTAQRYEVLRSRLDFVGPSHLVNNAWDVIWSTPAVGVFLTRIYRANLLSDYKKRK